MGTNRLLAGVSPSKRTASARIDTARGARVFRLGQRGGCRGGSAAARASPRAASCPRLRTRGRGPRPGPRSAPCDARRAASDTRACPRPGAACPSRGPVGQRSPRRTGRRGRLSIGAAPAAPPSEWPGCDRGRAVQGAHHPSWRTYVARSACGRRWPQSIGRGRGAGTRHNASGRTFTRCSLTDPLCLNASSSSLSTSSGRPLAIARAPEPCQRVAPQDSADPMVQPSDTLPSLRRPSCRRRSRGVCRLNHHRHRARGRRVAGARRARSARTP